MTILSMRNIKKSYDKATVLSIEDFTAERSEKVALVGANGSGKTTLLNVAALLLKPDSGEIEIDGKKADFRFPDECRSKITLVSQEPFFFSGSLNRNMSFGLKSNGLSKSEMRSEISRQLDRMRINHLAKRFPRSFSSGERKRAAVARALVHNTPILLLDEPFANVDSQSIEIIEKVIRENIENQTVIFTTHELSRAHDLSDRIVTLQNGQISPWSPENLFTFRAKLIPDGTEFVSQAGIVIYYPHELENDKTYTLSVNTSEVFISKERIETSAQNCYQGIIQRIESIGKNLYSFTVDCGLDFIIRATVTGRTVEAFRSTVGDKVWVHFKSSAIHVFR
jgi:ABC-type multidrug transport system ATPase subunit